MAKEKSLTSRRRRKRRIGLVTAAAVLLALVVAVGVFFRVKELRVEGNHIYTQAEILAASGLKAGGNVFLFKPGGAPEKICTALPYVRSARVVKELPGSILIKVTESVPAASVAAPDGRVWLMDAGCKLLESTDAQGAAGTVGLTGVVLSFPAAGALAAFETPLENQIAYLSDILSVLVKYDMLGDVTALNVSQPAAVTFRYQGKFEVRMGSGAGAEDKLLLLRSVSAQLEPEDTGVMDISIEGEAHFLKEAAPAAG